MTPNERDILRRKIYNAVREVYPDSDYFPENYEDCESGYNLAHFISAEIWEVMEGQETLDDCRDKAIFALHKAQEDMQTIIDTLEELF
jgi:hypothetical protein